MAKRVAILQSAYIPWKGYFDLIRSVDEFILFDTAQYTSRDWRNRNRIKTPNGPIWLSIPVEVKGPRAEQRICDTGIADPLWAKKHWRTISEFYARAAGRAYCAAAFEELFLGCCETNLSRVNEHFIRGICGMLEIETKLSWSMDYQLAEGKTERLVELCRQAGADTYISGPAARDYIDRSLFERAGIDLQFVRYDGYPEYRQLYPPFVHEVSVLDLLLNEGADAPRFMKGRLTCTRE